MSPRYITALAVLALPLTASAATLYSGTGVPSDQGWTNGFIGPVTQTPMTPGVDLNTSAAQAALGGYFLQLPANALDKTAGFQLTFTAALLSNAITNPLRAGLSVLVLTSDHTGIELAFQDSQIFAQTPGFTSSGESAAYTPSTLTTYHLTIDASGYTLSAPNLSLSGPLRDYSGYATPFGPIYSSTDLIFIGDDTTSASGNFQLTSVAVVPEPACIATMILPALSLRRRRSA